MNQSEEKHIRELVGDYGAWGDFAGDTVGPKGFEGTVEEERGIFIGLPSETA